MIITDALPSGYFEKLANATAERFGFQRFTPVELRRATTPNRLRPPLMRRCDIGTIWIDRWYIAVQIGVADVEYIYIAKAHIIEELASYRDARLGRGEAVELPEEIMVQFRRAMAYMRRTDSCVYLNRTGRELAEMWLENYRKAEAKAIAAKKAADRQTTENENVLEEAVNE